MTPGDERREFSKRLAEALRRVELHDAGPSRIAREFNLRYHGDPVTTQAVRKWLAGLALPSQDKMRVLAAWLDVQPHWLRFGDGAARETRNAARQETETYRADYPALSSKFEQLSESHRHMVFELVLALLRLEGKQ